MRACGVCTDEDLIVGVHEDLWCCAGFDKVRFSVVRHECILQQGTEKYNPFLQYLFFLLKSVQL